MRKLRAAAEVLSSAGRYREVTPERPDSKDPSPLKVKEVIHDDVRYIICVNRRLARKDSQDREAILHSLQVWKVRHKDSSLNKFFYLLSCRMFINGTDYNKRYYFKF